MCLRVNTGETGAIIETKTKEIETWKQCLKLEVPILHIPGCKVEFQCATATL